MTNRKVDDPEVQELYTCIMEGLFEAEKVYNETRDLMEENGVLKIIEDFTAAERDLKHHKDMLEWFEDKYGEERL